MKITRILVLAVALCTLPRALSTAGTQGTAFTYQGQLLNNGSPANGNYDLAVGLFDALTNGNALAPSLTNCAIPVSNGLFTVTLDFGAGVFTGSNYWLDISVRPNGASNSFTELTPRQFLASTPQSVYALNSGTAANAASTSNFSGAITGDVSGTQGATVVSAVGGQSAASIAQGVIAANGATSSNTPGAIVARDANGNFSAGSATLSGGLYLPFPAIIYSGTNTLLVSEGNLYIGNPAGSGGTQCVGIGDYAMQATTGMYNTAIGEQALNNDKTGSFNTASGMNALENNGVGSYNTADGMDALVHNWTASNNTATGAFALWANYDGSNNTANGSDVLYNNNGDDNTATGYATLTANTTGGENTADGSGALYSNNGDDNTATGYQALTANTTGTYNLADGALALYNNIDGGFNTATGAGALYYNTSGYENTAVGADALENSTSDNNIGIGSQAGDGLMTGNNDIYIGNQGTGTAFSSAESYTVRIGTEGSHTATYLAGTVYANGVALTSDRNAKENFTKLDGKSLLAKVAALPLTEWNYKNDAAGIRHLGPMAQDFQEAFQLNGGDDKHISVVDESGVALAAIQGLNQKLNEKDAEIQELKQSVDELKKLVQTLAEKVKP